MALVSTSQGSSSTAVDMALNAQPPDGFSWDRWNHAHVAQEYDVMDGLMHYDARPLGQLSQHQQRAPMPQPYLGPTYSTAPMASLTSSHFASHNPFSFNGYGPPPLREPYGQSSRQPFPDKDVQVTMTPMDGRKDNLSQTHRDMRPSFDDQGQDTSTRNESSEKTLTVPDGELPKVPRTITANATLRPEDQVTFSTSVDKLMRVVQAKKETDDIVRLAEDRIRRESNTLSPEVGSSTLSSPYRHDHSLTTYAEQTGSSDGSSDCYASGGSKKRKNPVKKHVCGFRGCEKVFGQKTHLLIHRRTHTGERPYPCKYPGCGKWFGQQGNLRSHQRSVHIGMRKYQCGVCGKQFAQRGNVKAHQENVHHGGKRFACKLEACKKEFSTRGNLKTHQNKFHKDALEEFGRRFASIQDMSELSEADREIWEHLATTYKNSNKGIKGRGKKGENQGPGNSQSPESTALSSPFPVDVQAATIGHQAYAADHVMTPPSTLSPGSSVGFPSPTGHRPPMLPTHLGNAMYDAKVGGGEMMATNTSGTIYDAHARDVVFQDRGYERGY